MSSTTSPMGPFCAALTQQDIERGLRRLGLVLGDAVEVHSSLRSFGWVEGGAAAVVDALMDVGEEGALVMSAYALTPALPLTEEEKARGILARVRFLGEATDERTGMGAIADEFRGSQQLSSESASIECVRGDTTPTYIARGMSICWMSMDGFSYWG